MSGNITGRTDRGFAYFGEFPSKWHGKMRVQESSAAFRGPCAWVFCELAYDNNPRKNPPHLHLQYQDALNLRDALNRFLGAVKDGDTMEKKEVPEGEED